MDKKNIWKIYVSIAAISIFNGLQFSLSPVLSNIRDYYRDVDVSLIQMLVTAPALLAMVISLFSGWLVLRFSYRKLLIFSALTAGISGFLPFLSVSFGLLLFSRVLFGIGLGFATTLNVAVVAEFFEGKARMKAMGFQAASVGAGMVVVNLLSGVLGKSGFQNAYFVNILAFVSLLIFIFLLPDTGVVKVSEKAPLKLNKKVYFLDLLAFLEFLFLISFTTNISMHLSGKIAGDSLVIGLLTGLFSLSQIVVGLILSRIARVTKRFTLAVAMASFALGAILLAANSSAIVLLVVGAVFCGFSQGIFMPTALTEISDSVSKESTTLAAATFTCAMNIGQFVSPTVLNNIVKICFGNVRTGNVYLIAAIGMVLASLMVFITKLNDNKTK